MRKANILFVVPYPLNVAPGQRFRFELFLRKLEDQGHRIRVEPFLDQKTMIQIYKRSRRISIFSGLLGGYLRRMKLLFTVGSYDIIYIFREATPLGPPVFEWVLHVKNKKIIYDFDDAIWMKDDSENQALALVKNKSKVIPICKWSTIITVGNEYLANFAKQYNSNVQVIPTVVDTNYHFPVKSGPNKITIGWTGSHSTLPYLESILPVLRRLHQQVDFRFLIIADKSPGYNDAFIEFRKWKIETEINDLNEIDIGIMPLPDSAWARGKCGFKLIQYLSLEIPAVASDVGVNRDVLMDAGFICRTHEEWEQSLLKLLKNEDLRVLMGKSGREHIIKEYSAKAVEMDFLHLFN